MGNYFLQTKSKNAKNLKQCLSWPLLSQPDSFLAQQQTTAWKPRLNWHRKRSSREHERTETRSSSSKCSSSTCRFRERTPRKRPKCCRTDAFVKYWASGRKERESPEMIWMKSARSTSAAPSA